MIERPQPNEYSNFYKGYIDQVPEGEILGILEDQADVFSQLIKDVSKDKELYSYGPGKWTTKEVIGHMIDTERIMSSRLLRFARQDKTNMPGFNQNDYVEDNNFNNRSLASLSEEFYFLRKSNIALINSLTEKETMYTGQANDVIFSVRALIFILAGHLNHHLNILNEKYL